VDVNETDEYGYTGLHMAAENGHLEIVTMLLVGGVGGGVSRYLWHVGTWCDVKGGGTRVGDENNFISVTKKMRNNGTLVQC
jgi:ankyrin repeat protein